MLLVHYCTDSLLHVIIQDGTPPSISGSQTGTRDLESALAWLFCTDQESSSSHEMNLLFLLHPFIGCLGLSGD